MALNGKTPISALARLAAAVALAIGMALSGPAHAIHKDGHPSPPNGEQTTTLSDLQCDADQVAQSDGAGGWSCAEDADSNALDALDCADGDFARLDPTSGEWECLSLVDLKAALEGLTNTVFATSFAGYTGDLVSEASDTAQFDPPYAGSDGLEAGDFICNAHAKDAGLPGDYVAWLSTSAADAKDRLTPGSGPFHKVNDDLVAQNIGDLTDGDIFSPIDVDENGNALLDQVWTGTDSAGVSDGRDCEGWLKAVTISNIGIVGDTSRDDPRWTLDVFANCSLVNGLYCFQK